MKVPFFVDLSRPDKILNHTTNLYLPTEEGVTVGVWSVMSLSLTWPLQGCLVT